jgi:hypothetical protein
MRRGAGRRRRRRRPGVSWQQQLNQDQSRSRAIAAVLNAPDAAMMTVAPAAPRVGTIVMSHQLTRSCSPLPSLPSSERTSYG